MSINYSKEFLLDLYKDLLEARMLEQFHIDMYRIGEISAHIHSGIGEEAVAVATNAVMGKDDYIKLSHRCYASAYLRGVSLESALCQTRGRLQRNGDYIGPRADKELGILGMSPTLGIDFCINTGVAMAIKLQKQKRMVFSINGDGTCGRGQFHEALNFAAIGKLPILFIVDNNQYAISMPIEKAIPVDNIADRAAGYNIPSIVSDGTDILAVYESISKMAEYVREGNGPALVEVKTYRMRGHFEGDQTKYRSPDKAKEWGSKDCLKNYEKLLIEQGVLTEELRDKLTNSFKKEIDKNWEYAGTRPYPEPSDELLYFGLYESRGDYNA